MHIGNMLYIEHWRWRGRFAWFKTSAHLTWESRCTFLHCDSTLMQHKSWMSKLIRSNTSFQTTGFAVPSFAKTTHIFQVPITVMSALQQHNFVLFQLQHFYFSNQISYGNGTLYNFSAFFGKVFRPCAWSVPKLAIFPVLPLLFLPYLYKEVGYVCIKLTIYYRGHFMSTQEKSLLVNALLGWFMCVT